MDNEKKLYLLKLLFIQKLSLDIELDEVDIQELLKCVDDSAYSDDIKTLIIGNLYQLLQSSKMSLWGYDYRDGVSSIIFETVDAKSIVESSVNENDLESFHKCLVTGLTKEISTNDSKLINEILNSILRVYALGSEDFKKLYSVWHKEIKSKQ